jgi:outer membrane protein assembly factor BamB
MRRSISFCQPGLLLLVSSVVAADDTVAHWPAWRGPTMSGVAPGSNPPLTWSETEHLAWKTPIPGAGHGSPIVWGDRLYVSSAVATDRMAEAPPVADESAKTTPSAQIYEFVVTCLDRNTGDIVWSRTIHEGVPREGRHETNSYASASPVTDGMRLYVSFGSQGLFCLDLEGNTLWERDLGEMRTRFGWGEGASPAVSENRVVVNWDHEDASFIVALDAATGDEVWRQPREEPTSWATPVVITGERTQVVVNGTNRVRSYDLATGEVLWECGGQTINAIPSPVYDERAVYVMSGYRGAALFALPLSATGDLTGSSSVFWSFDRGTPYVPSPVLVDGRLYFTGSNNGILTCVDVATGQVVFGPERIPDIDNIYASPVSAAGRIYFTSRDGVTTVIAATDHLEVLATNRIDEPVDASAAIAGDTLYLRGSRHVYAFREE